MVEKKTARTDGTGDAAGHAITADAAEVVSQHERQFRLASG